MSTVERRVRAMINPWSTAFARWWCHSAARFTLTGHGPRRRVRRRDRDVVRPTGADTAASRMPQAVRIEPLTQVDVASAVELAVRALRVKPGDRGEQFASDITGNSGWLLPQRRAGGPGVARPGYRHGADTRSPALGIRPHRRSVLCRRGQQHRLTSPSRGSRIPGGQALRERPVRSWRRRTVAAGEDYGHLWAGTAGSPTALAAARIAAVRIGSGWTNVPRSVLRGRRRTTLKLQPKLQPCPSDICPPRAARVLAGTVWCPPGCHGHTDERGHTSAPAGPCADAGEGR